MMVTSLLKAGADVNAQTTRGSTALHYGMHLKRKDLVGTLLKEGADIHLKDETGKFGVGESTE